MPSALRTVYQEWRDDSLSRPAFRGYSRPVESRPLSECPMPHSAFAFASEWPQTIPRNSQGSERVSRPVALFPSLLRPLTARPRRVQRLSRWELVAHPTVLPRFRPQWRLAYPLSAVAPLLLSLSLLRCLVSQTPRPALQTCRCSLLPHALRYRLERYLPVKALAPLPCGRESRCRLR